MRVLEQTRHCLLNNHIIHTLETERERLRECVLDRDAEGSDITMALSYFAKVCRKVDQAYRLKARLVSKELV